MKRKNVIKLVALIISVIIVGFIGVNINKRTNVPLPQVSEGERGTLGIDKNVNESTIDNYIGRNDSVYMDVRMLKDPGNYEAIGGDSYLSGFVKGFSVLSLPYLIPVSGLPEVVGNTYQGKTLFSIKDGKYVANYKESLEILEYFFPKDKKIFLMCGGGGYAGIAKNLLVSLGWDKNKIYNVGGYWYYEGENNVEVKNSNGGYDFWKVNYHEIDFDNLTEVK